MRVFNNVIGFSSHEACLARPLQWLWVRPRTRPIWRMGWTKLATWSRRLSQCRPSPVSTLLLAGWGRPVTVLSKPIKPSQSKAAPERRCAARCCMRVYWQYPSALQVWTLHDARARNMASNRRFQLTATIDRQADSHCRRSNHPIHPYPPQHLSQPLLGQFVLSFRLKIACIMAFVQLLSGIAYRAVDHPAALDGRSRGNRFGPADDMNILMPRQKLACTVLCPLR